MSAYIPKNTQIDVDVLVKNPEIIEMASELPAEINIDELTEDEFASLAFHAEAEAENRGVVSSPMAVIFALRELRL